MHGNFWFITRFLYPWCKAKCGAGCFDFPAGGRSLPINYHSYDGMVPRTSVMTVGPNGELQSTLAIWFQKQPNQAGRKMMDCWPKVLHCLRFCILLFVDLFKTFLWSHGLQDRHLIRCSDVPTSIIEATMQRPGHEAQTQFRASSHSNRAASRGQSRGPAGDRGRSPADRTPRRQADDGSYWSSNRWGQPWEVQMQHSFLVAGSRF